MLKITINKKECITQTIGLNIKNANINNKKINIETADPLLISENDKLYFRRKFHNELIYEEPINFQIEGQNKLIINEFEDKVIYFDSCEEIDGIVLPYQDLKLKALKFTSSQFYTITNRNITIKDVYSNVFDANSFYGVCMNDYVRYDEIFLLKIKNIKKGLNPFFYEDFYNTKVNFYFKSGDKIIYINGFIGIDFNGNDDAAMYWLYDEKDIEKKNYILENFKNIVFYGEDKRFLVRDGNKIYPTKDFQGDVDTFLEYEKNDLKFNLLLNDNFNPSLQQNEYYNQLYVNEQKTKNINKIVDMEKQIFEPRIKWFKNESGVVLQNLIDYDNTYTKFINDGIVDEIIFNLNFIMRENNDWNNNNLTNHYYDNGNADSISLYNLGFTEDDIKYQKNVLKKSFLRLSFYDTNKRNNQNLLFYSTIFFNTNTIFSDFIKDKNNVRGSFRIKNSFDYLNSSEGYYLYLFPNLCKGNSETIIYMKVEFNHAKYGKKIPLLLPSFDGFIDGYIDSTSQGFTGIEKLFNDLFIPIKICYSSEENKYIWYFDNYNINDYENKKMVLNLYEPIVNKK